MSHFSFIDIFCVKYASPLPSVFTHTLKLFMFAGVLNNFVPPHPVKKKKKNCNKTYRGARSNNFLKL